MSANTTLLEDLRRKLEAMVGPNQTADDLANEVIGSYIREHEQQPDWTDLVSYGRKTGSESGYTELDVVDLVHETRRGQ